MYYDVFQILEQSLCQLCVSESDQQTTTTEDNTQQKPETEQLSLRYWTFCWRCWWRCKTLCIWRHVIWCVDIQNGEKYLRFVVLSALLSITFICSGYVASVIGKWMSMECLRNDGCGVKLNYSEKILSLCHVARHKSHNILKWHSVDTGKYLTDTVQYLLLLLLHYGR